MTTTPVVITPFDNDSGNQNVDVSVYELSHDPGWYDFARFYKENCASRGTNWVQIKHRIKEQRSQTGKWKDTPDGAFVVVREILDNHLLRRNHETTIEESLAKPHVRYITSQRVYFRLFKELPDRHKIGKWTRENIIGPYNLEEGKGDFRNMSAKGIFIRKDVVAHFLGLGPCPDDLEDPKRLAAIPKIKEFHEMSRDELLALTDVELRMVLKRLKWLKTARKEQLTPDGDWDIWMILAGRGWGKTATGAEDISWYAMTHPKCRCAVMAPTTGDVRDTCFEGVSGLLSAIPAEWVAAYNRSLLEITLINGAKIKGFSGQEPERLRGPQHHRAWIDELAAFPKETLRDAWDMLMFGLRLGVKPQVVITTTPKPIPKVREILKDAEAKPKKYRITRGSTYENRENLAPTFFDQITQYEGTQLGRQEIHAEVLDPEETGIIKRSWFRLWPARKELPRFEYVVQSYDTAYTEKTENDPTACTVWGVFANQTGDFEALLCDCWSEHLNYPTLRARVETDSKVLYGDPERPVDLLLIEEKGSGITLIQDLARIPSVANKIRAYNPGRLDKVQRLHAVSHLFANGKFWLPESMLRPGHPRDWCEPFLNQICAFPLVDNDDFVDTASQAAAILRDMEFLSIDVVESKEDFDYHERRKRKNPYAV